MRRSSARQSGQGLTKVSEDIPKRPSVDQLKLGLHHQRPQQVREPVGRRTSGASGIGNRAHREAAFGRRGRAAERVQEHAVDGFGDGRERRRARAAAAAALAAAGDPCSGSTSNTKNRTAGLSVDPISLRGLSSAMLPRKRVKPRRKCRRPGATADARERSARRLAAALDRRVTASPARRPASTTTARSLPVGADELRARPQRLDALGRVRSVVLRDQPELRRVRRRRCRTCSRVALRPATVLLNRLSGSGGSWPTIRRAPRDSDRVSISPLTSSSACGVVAWLGRDEVT